MPLGWDVSNSDVAVRGVIPRPDRVADGNPETRTRDMFYDVSAFVRPARGAGTFRNAGVGTLVGPGLFSSAAGVAKTASLTDKLRMRIEATFTDVPNHPNFVRPDTNIGNAAFGKLQRSFDNRLGQIGARLDW
jgi:hypothetical protein